MVVQARLIRAAALAFFLDATPASAQEFNVVGACRGGSPNGAYAAYGNDGTLRVAGAFAQGRKTGTFIFWSTRGARVAVIPYDDDARTGTVALWYTAPSNRREGKRKLEAPYVGDHLHGIKRSWHPDGTPRAVFRYEHGALVSASAWTAMGVPLVDADAVALAAREAANDEQFYGSLERIVRNNLPRCE